MLTILPLKSVLPRLVLLSVRESYQSLHVSPQSVKLSLRPICYFTFDVCASLTSFTICERVVSEPTCVASISKVIT